MNKPSKPSSLNVQQVETVLNRLHTEASKQFGALLLHYLPKLPGFFLGKGIQWDQTKTEFYSDKYIPIERDQAQSKAMISVKMDKSQLAT
ncbi:MAG: hypothetical protein V7K25_03365 [Nostoc sp.]|uniref:hypothetical protein n=1 Tax=Nostoc sp. TaxID=1180 RepID=UPI002FFA7B64